jgi:hypothetical protein
LFNIAVWAPAILLSRSLQVDNRRRPYPPQIDLIFRGQSTNIVMMYSHKKAIRENTLSRDEINEKIRTLTKSGGWLEAAETNPFFDYLWNIGNTKRIGSHF